MYSTVYDRFQSSPVSMDAKQKLVALIHFECAAHSSGSIGRMGRDKTTEDQQKKKTLQIVAANVELLIAMIKK